MSLKKPKDLGGSESLKKLKDDGKPRKRVPYGPSWRTQLTSTESMENSRRDDFQKLSDKIRPANTIFKDPLDAEKDRIKEELEEDY